MVSSLAVQARQIIDHISSTPWSCATFSWPVQKSARTSSLTHWLYAQLVNLHGIGVSLQHARLATCSAVSTCTPTARPLKTACAATALTTMAPRAKFATIPLAPSATPTTSTTLHRKNASVCLLRQPRSLITDGPRWHLSSDAAQKTVL